MTHSFPEGDFFCALVFSVVLYQFAIALLSLMAVVAVCELTGLKHDLMT